MDEINWDWEINDLEEMGNREAWEDAQAEGQEEDSVTEDHSDEEMVEDGDWEDDLYYPGTGESIDDESYINYLNRR
jgi:hypothetical protein